MCSLLVPVSENYQSHAAVEMGKTRDFVFCWQALQNSEHDDDDGG
jgi:hypothetical protein